MQPAMICYMAAMTTRELAGAIVRDERARRYRNVADALGELKISRAALGKMEAGNTVGDLVLRAIEGGLNLPTHFLSYVIAGDADKIKRLPSKTDDPLSGIREDLRVYVLMALEDIAQPRNRRRTDRKPNSA